MDRELPARLRVWVVPLLGTFLAGVFFSTLWFLRSPWYPPVGTFIAILALIGTLVPFFRDTARMGKGEKALWTFVVLALVFLEIRSIYKDRTAAELREQAARDAQLKGFNEIANGIKASVKASQDQFNATAEKLSANLDTLTGGLSYCYMSFTPGRPILFFVHGGDFPLYGVYARIVELTPDGKVLREPTLNNLFDVGVDVGDIIEHHAVVRAVPQGLGTSLSDSFDANIFFSARNGDWMELLRERREGDKWVTATRVLGRFTSLKSEKVMCQKIDPAFPLKPNGDIDVDFRSLKGSNVSACP